MMAHETPTRSLLPAGEQMPPNSEQEGHLMAPWAVCLPLWAYQHREGRGGSSGLVCALLSP